MASETCHDLVPTAPCASPPPARPLGNLCDQLKNISQIEHSRHRSPVNGMVNLLGGLIAYCHQPKKPSLNLDGLQQPA